ncbi:MAG: DUF485 domain-containing protein [bacterium]
MQKTAHEIMQEVDFKKLVSQKNRISILLTIIQSILYFGFIGLIAFNKPFLMSKISKSITIGIPIAISVIILSWILTGIYIFWANQKYDILVKNIKEKIGE